MKMLIIDDDEQFRIYLTHIIQKEFDADVKFAGNGKEGIAITIKFRPDIIFLDDAMPEMSGDQFIRKIRSDHKFNTTPIIVMTASNDNTTLGKYIDFEISDYILKPFTKQNAIDKIKKVIHERSRLVLHVDDNSAFQKFVEKVINSKFQHCRVMHASDGIDALKKISLEAPNLILLDVNMPNMSGDEFLKKIREINNLKNINVVIVSSQNELELIKEVKKLGLSDYILKPVSMQDLFLKLNKYLN